MITVNRNSWNSKNTKQKRFSTHWSCWYVVIFHPVGQYAFSEGLVAQSVVYRLVFCGLVCLFFFAFLCFATPCQLFFGILSIALIHSTCFMTYSVLSKVYKSSFLHCRIPFLAVCLQYNVLFKYQLLLPDKFVLRRLIYCY